MRDQIYPGANTTSQWYADDYPGRNFDANCGVLHTTEGTSWPSYSGGATAPNITARYNFSTKKLDFRQHFPIDMSSRALRNLSGGVETNTLNVVQVELVGTCDPRHRHSWNGEGRVLAGRHYIYWPEAPDSALRSLAEFMHWCAKEHSIPLRGPADADWKAYPSSYGATSTRFTFAEWRSFEGWCGHQHVPENTHGDPGNIKFSKLLSFAGALQPDPMRPDNPATREPTRLPSTWSKALHAKRPGQPYHEINSVKGLIRYQNSYNAVDLDMLITKDNRIVNTHWPRPMRMDGFKDPLGKLDYMRTVSSLTWEEVKRLRAGNDYRISTIAEMISKGTELGYRLELEAKGDERFEYGKGGLGIFRRIRDHAKKAEAKPGLLVKVEARGSKDTHALNTLKAAHRAGLKTMVLPRGTRRIPKSWWPYIDHVRGAVWWV